MGKKVVRGCVVAEMRIKVKTAPLQQLKSVYDTAISTTSANETDSLLLPSYQSVATILKRQRSHDIPKLPKTRSEINLVGKWCETLDGKKFLLYSSTENCNDIIIFASEMCLLRLANVSNNLPGRNIQMRP